MENKTTNLNSIWKLNSLAINRQNNPKPKNRPRVSQKINRKLTSRHLQLKIR